MVANRSKTHCPQDHPYSEINTYIDSNNRRHCKTCGRRRSRERYANRTPAVKAAHKVAINAKRKLMTRAQRDATNTYHRAWYAKRKEQAEAGVQS